jgi:cytochrome P450
VCVVCWTIASLVIASSIGKLINWSNSTGCMMKYNSGRQYNHQPYARGNIPYISYYLPQGSSLVYFGQLYNFLIQRPWDLLKEWHELYGPIINFTLLGQNYVSVANSPSLLKCILQIHIQYIKKDINNTMKPFLSILGTGIVSSEGQHWLQQRMKMSHPLRFDVLHRIPYQTLVALQRLMEHFDITIKKACKTNATTSSIPLGSMLRHLTLQVISSTFLSLSASESDTTFARLYLPIVDESNLRVWHPYRSYLFILPSWWYYHYNVFQLNNYVSTLILKRWTVRLHERKNRNVLKPQHQDPRLEQQSNINENTYASYREEDILDQILYDIERREPDLVVLPKGYVHQIRDELKTFMLAGHETSAAMMTWSIYELILLQHQSNKNCTSSPSETSIPLCNVVQEMIKEANSVFDPAIDWKNAKKKDIPNIEVINNLNLSEACLKEALRKYCVVPTVTRRTIQDITLSINDDSEEMYTPATSESNETNSMSSSEVNGQRKQQQKGSACTYFIPAKTTILINIQACHWNPKYWPNPAVYDPNRFYQKPRSSGSSVCQGHPNGSNSNKRDSTSNSETNNANGNYDTMIQPFTFIPFIAGPRNCLGQNLALLESKMVLSLLLQRYNIHFDTPSDWITCTDPRHRFTVPVIPYKDIMVHVTLRK